MAFNQQKGFYLISIRPIYLDRITRKKEIFFSIYTIKGKKEIKRNQVNKKSFPDAKFNLPKNLPDKKLDSLLKPRLQDFINNLGKKDRSVYQQKQDEKEFERIAPPTDEHQLWRFIIKEFADVFETGVNANQIAEKWYREFPSSKQVESIDEIIAGSKSQGNMVKLPLDQSIVRESDAVNWPEINHWSLIWILLP